MPVVEIVTNVPAENAPAGLVGRAAKVVSEMMDRPLPAVTVCLRHETMFRMGSDDPCAMIFIASVDAFNDHDNNRRYSKELIDFAATELNVPAARVNLLMQNLSRWQIGLPDGKLLGDRMKEN
ncbi:D-dopachrome decarboxylase-like [Diadema antillarum]|uniref:D-dopachrome decarboxylase-like n=1 Tax=Diadema antillarum TaxID=105358 RepID=UPI003A8A4099